MNKNNLKLVDVKMEHIDLLFDWVNEIECRKNSFNSEKIKYDEHKKWLINKLNDKACKMYLYVHDNEFVGQVRVDIQQEIGFIGYSIREDYRGCGHGSKILYLLENEIKKIKDINIKYLAGKVKKDNIASQKVFEKLGYIGEIKEEYIIYSKKLSIVEQ